MNGEGGRSREAVRDSIRTYGVKVMDPASLPMRITEQRESQESDSRLSEKTRQPPSKIRKGCRQCVNRMPWATFFGFVFVIVGLLMFIVASLRSAALTNRMIADVLVEDSSRIATFDIVFIVLEASTGVLAILILLVGVLATGETRSRVYNTMNARVTGKFSIVILMFITSVLLLAWLLVFWLFSILFYVGIVSQSVCQIEEEMTDKTCLHLTDLRIFANVDSNDIEICGKTKIKAFCSDFAEKTSPAFVIAGIGVFLIILGLITLLVCLAANYARIRCQARYGEVDEIRRFDHPEIRIIKHRV